MQNNRQLSICYEDFFGERCDNLLINPYCLKMFKRRWYVLAYVPSTNIIRRFGLDRIQKIKTTENTFKYPKDFSPEEYFRGFFGVVHDAEPLTIQLKAYREKPNYLRSLPLHLSQQEVETGTDYAIFEYKIAPTFDFIQEILLHGDQLEVLSPKSFREHVASIIKQMSDFYK
jgi:predicted DNA-binding transcriptional regulator YafY